MSSSALPVQSYSPQRLIFKLTFQTFWRRYGWDCNYDLEGCVHCSTACQHLHRFHRDELEFDFRCVLTEYFHVEHISSWRTELLPFATFFSYHPIPSFCRIIPWRGLQDRSYGPSTQGQGLQPDDFIHPTSRYDSARSRLVRLRQSQHILTKDTSVPTSSTLTPRGEYRGSFNSHVCIRIAKESNPHKIADDTTRPSSPLASQPHSKESTLAIYTNAIPPIKTHLDYSPSPLSLLPRTIQTQIKEGRVSIVLGSHQDKNQIHFFL